MTSAIFILILSLPLTGFAESVDSKIQEGISQYHEGNFKDAGQSFSSARLDRPDDSRIAYNQGNAHYKEGSFPEALQAFTQSSLDKKNPDIRKNAIYNTGNTLVKLGKLKEAEAAYKKVLRLDPDDMDAKFNLEYIREQLKKKEEQDSDQGAGHAARNLVLHGKQIIFLRHAEEIRDDQNRKRGSEASADLDRARVGELVEQFACEAAHEDLVVLQAIRSHQPANQRAVARMLRRVECEQLPAQGDFGSPARKHFPDPLRLRFAL